MPTINDVRSWRGQDLVDAEGGKIGSIEEIYVDSDTDQVEWALVTTGLFGSKQSFVPLDGASETAEGIRVPFDKGTVKDAPKIDPDGRLSQQEEAQLYRHYGREYSATRSDSGLPEGGAATGTYDDGAHSGPGRDVSGPNTDDAMTRSEEELHVGKSEHETGRVRLKKYVVEDEFTQTVPVRREEVRVEREPITEANRDAALDGPAISEEEHEVVLHAEEPVVEKRTVPKERVRLDKDVDTGEREVSETVRKERIDVEDAR